MNPLSLGYQSVSGVASREWVNTNPKLVQPSISNHSDTVQNARFLATEKNADVAVFSRRYLGKQSETVAVPIATTTTTGYSQYANNQYASQSEAGATTTTYQYQNQKYDLWEHKTTLLRHN